MNSFQNMSNYQLNIYKPVGKTPVEMIELLRKKFPEYSHLKISYAGRLDPMACGVLILLVGENENKERRKRELSDKEYEFQLLSCIQTDSYDILGIPTLSDKEADVRNEIDKYIGEIYQRPPIFSSYRIKGKPSFIYASNNQINIDDLPKIKRVVFSLKYISSRRITGKELRKEVFKRISLINSEDFRQEKIIKEYNRIIDDKMNFTIHTIQAHVSSGTYIRSICNELHGCALEIKRTRSGKHKLTDSIIL